MTPIEELRNLLDERGVWWHNDKHGNVWWTGTSGHMYFAKPYGNAGVELSGCLTPEQTIEATLGRPTAYRHVKSYGEYGICTCSACHADVEQSDNYCGRCGARLTHTTYEEVDKYAPRRS